MRASLRPGGVLSPQDLGAAFEGLGDNCEFGLVQRACGVEPLGLFRFAGAAIANIIDVIATDGRHLFTADDVLIETTADGEYYLRSRHYNDFPFHTHVYEKDVGLDEFRAKRLAMLAYLKNRFFDELRNGEKIFVRKGSASLEELRRLREALSRFRPRILLNVNQADALHAPGSLERIERGLCRGCVTAFITFSRPGTIDVKHWVPVLAEAVRRAGTGARLAERRVLVTKRQWAIAAEQAHLDHESLRSRAGTPLILRGSTAAEGVFATADVSLAAAEDTVATLSTRVWLDEHYEGGPIILNLLDVADTHLFAADPTRRGEWQTIFVVVKLTPKGGQCTLAVRTFCARGSRLVLAPWTMEVGINPREVARRIERRSAGTARRLPLHLKQRLRRRHARAGRRDVSELAAHAMADGSFVEADDLLSAAVTAAPGDALLLKQYALSAHHSGRYAEALGRWHAALTAAPDDTMCVAGLACTYRDYGYPAVAQDIIKPRLKDFPDDLMILSETARVASACRQPAEAVRLWDRVIAIHGTHPDWVVGRTQALEAAALATPETANAETVPVETV